MEFIKKNQFFLPKASNCLFPEPGGLPRCFLAEGSVFGVAVAPSLEDSNCPPPPPAAVAPVVTGAGAKASAMLPSGDGEYFLGRPRFFLAGSMLNPPALNPPGGDDPSPYWSGPSKAKRCCNESGLMILLLFVGAVLELLGRWWW